MKLRVVDIVRGTTVDGPGFRTSIYFAGCRLHCQGCHNPHTWDFEAGFEMTTDEIAKIVDDEDFDVTFSGGDPLEQAAALVELAKSLKVQGRNIWCYTGRLFEDVKDIPEVGRLLSYVDVLVDGPFVECERDTSLLFRGSRNQRLVDVVKSQNEGRVVEWSSDF